MITQEALAHATDGGKKKDWNSFTNWQNKKKMNGKTIYNKMVEDKRQDMIDWLNKILHNYVLPIKRIKNK